MTKFGPQPILYIIKQSRQTIVDVAAMLDVDYHTLYGVISGRLLLTDDLKMKIEKLFAVPINDLFTSEVLLHKDRRGGDRRKFCGCSCDIHGKE